MKHKIIIGLSVSLLLLAVVLISRDLFRTKPALTEACCDDMTTEMKKIDTTQLGYYRSSLWETGIKGLTGIFVSGNKIIVAGNNMIAIFDTLGNRTGGFDIDSSITCIAIIDDEIIAGNGPSAIRMDFNGKQFASLKTPWQKSYITSIAADEDFIYLADAGKRSVWKFSKTGELIQEIGKKDSTSGSAGFIVPSPYFDIACGIYNDLWIANPGRLRVENYSSTGVKRFEWGTDLSVENRFTGCCNPAHFALLPDGGFITYEKGTDKIKQFDATGIFRTMVAGAGSFKGKSDFVLGRNNLVKDLATGTSGSVYILDAYNRINVFRPFV